MAGSGSHDEPIDGLDAILMEAFGSAEAEARAPDDLKQAERRYEIEHEIGRGGQGVVYLARDLLLNRRVALKVLTGLHGSDPARLERFRREAQVASRLHHPGICAVFDQGTRCGVPFITMPYLHGESLSAKLARARFDKAAPTALLEDVTADGSESRTSSSVSQVIASIVRLIEKTAWALHSAHEAGVVHRDVKPGNIMVRPDGEPILLDFGLARDDSTLPTVTRSGEVFGTPAYMSPEQTAGDGRPIDRRSDVYSLGVVLFEALTLQRPFAGRRVENAHRRDTTPPDPRGINPAVSRELGVVVQTAIDPDPRRRYATAQDLAEDLRRVLKREPILARRASPALKLRRWVQRNPAPTLTGVVLAAGLVVTLLLLDAARTARDASEQHLANWQILADAGRAEHLVREADRELWPPTPEKTSAMERWIARAESLVAKLPRHRAILAELRSRALPYDERARAHDRALRYDEASDAEFLDARIAKGRRRLEELASHGARRRRIERARDDLDTLLMRREELERTLSERLTWEFADAQDAWRHDQQARLVELVAALAVPDEYGPTIAGMRRRLAFAATVRERTVEDHADAWRRVQVELAADERFDGLELEPQVGLVPLGRDPASGLQEFALLQTGEVPERNAANGKLVMTCDSALVLVLVPGGKGLVGAQSEDPDKPLYQKGAQEIWGPVNEVTLGPFFISKFEMTQGQWERITGENPSSARAGYTYVQGPVTHLHPVERVTWDDCRETLGKIGCGLPTEAQWEYACRAGTRTPWYTGADVSSLVGHANLADETGARYWGRKRRRIVAGFDDGHLDHAPVGTFAANPWGLHDVHGNVWEICLDAADYTEPARPPDGRRPRLSWISHHIVRGGSYMAHAEHATSAARSTNARSYCHIETGVRPARPIDR